jgi:hypothetical protein
MTKWTKAICQLIQKATCSRLAYCPGNCFQKKALLIYRLNVSKEKQWNDEMSANAAALI